MSSIQPETPRSPFISRRALAWVALLCVAAVAVSLTFISNRSSNSPHSAATPRNMIAPGSPSPSYSADQGNGTKPAFATLGLGVPGGSPKQLKTAADTGLPAKWARLYTNAIPANLNDWPDAKAAAGMGFKLWLSITPQVTKLAAGGYDTALAQFVKTLPAGTRLTTNHEPSNKAKGITPAAFAAGWNHGAKVILDASGGSVEPWAIEVQANVIKRHYLNGLNSKLVDQGGIGLDGYDGIGGAASAVKSFQQVAEDSFAYTTQLFPNARVGFAEFNSSRTTGWAKWVAAGLAWCKHINASVAVLFTSLGEWQKTPQQLHQLATILNGS